MENKKFKLSDQVIGQIRECLQFSLILGESFVDHCRAVELEESTSISNTLILSEEYVQGWNKMVKDLQARATAQMEKLTKEAEEISQTKEEDPESKKITVRPTN